MKPTTIDEMIKDGCTMKFAKFYYDLLEKEEKSGLFDKELVNWAHSKGFLAESACAYGLSDENYLDYLSDYDYYKAWPLNSWMRIWVNDKLTLKYMLAGTKYDEIMPKYYFYSTEDGLKSLIDNIDGKQSVEGLIEVLKEVGSLACKPANGTGSNGFFHIQYDGNIRINGKVSKEEDIEKFVMDHPNYVFTEYLFPISDLAELSNNIIHTLRLVVLNEEGNNPSIEGGYFRFATKAHGATNHMNDEGNGQAEFDLVTQIDYVTGEFGDAYAVYHDRKNKMKLHPDTGKVIAGKIDNWEEIKKNVLEIAKFFFGVEWIGFDLCIDSNGKLRIMEINTHPGIKYMQLYQPLYKKANIKQYITNKLLQINDMDAEKKEHRVKTPR